MTRLQVTQVKIKDVLGIEEFAMEPGQITVLSGVNASGKTARLQAIQAAIGGGDLGKIARLADDSDPEVVLVLDSDEGQYRVKKTASGIKVKKQVGSSAAFENVGKPQFFLSGLFDGKLSNPLKFLAAKDKERVIWLLEALDIELDRGDLLKAMGVEANDLPPIPDGLHPLQELAWIHKAVFEQRTGVNRDAAAKAKTCDQIKRATPAQLPPEHKQQIEALDQETRTEENRIGADMEIVKKEYERSRETARREAQSDIDAVWAEHQKFELEIMAEANEEISHHNQAAHKLTENIGACAEKDINTGQKIRDQRLETLFGQQKTLQTGLTKLATMRQEHEESIRTRTLLQEANQFEAEAEALQADSERLTAGLTALDAYRRGLADDLPIPGLEVDGTVIRVDGIPLDQLNTQKQFDVAVATALLRSKDKKLPVLFVDGAEALDSDRFELFVKAIQSYTPKVQAFIGVVDDHELKAQNANEYIEERKRRAEAK